MARQGRCNAILAVAVLLVSFAAVAHGATYTVGDRFGWVVPGSFNTTTTYLEDWAKDKTFAKDDILVFRYNSSFHNVLTVNSAAYEACNLANPLLRSATGNDNLTLVAGDNHYICGVIGHCVDGQKIKITTAAGTPATPTDNSAATTAVSVFSVLVSVAVTVVAFW